MFLLGGSTALTAGDAALTSLFGTVVAKFAFSGTGKAGNGTVAVLSLSITHFLQ